MLLKDNYKDSFQKSLLSFFDKRQAHLKMTSDTHTKHKPGHGELGMPAKH